MRTFNWIASLILAVAVSACEGESRNSLDKIRQAHNNTHDPVDMQDWHQKQDGLEETLDVYWPVALELPNLCEQLTHWSDEELLDLYPKISESPETKLNCKTELISRIEIIRNQRVTQVFRSKKGPKLAPCKNKNLPEKLDISSEVKTIDTFGGPRFVTGDLPKCVIALTFDDGPHPTYTKEVLEILKAYQTGAVFFEMGSRVSKNQKLSQLVADSGHTLANHTWTHQNMPKMTVAAGQVEIDKGFAALLKTERQISPFFRFPYGAFTKDLRSYLVKSNVSEFFWNMDTLDWKLKDPAALYENVVKEIDRERRGIILFHDVHPQTVDILPKLLTDLNEAGYRTVQFVPKHEFPVVEKDEL